MSSLAQAGAELRAGRTSSEALVADAFRSLERWEPSINAWISHDREQALQRASELDAELALGIDRGPLHGVPLGVKDNLATADFATTCASKVTAGLRTGTDADSVARLRDAGAVVIGKTNLHELAIGNPYVSEVANPFDLTRNASGSSSGTAAATAASTVFGGLGTDSGGSVRLPAAVCGVVGLKATFGRVSLDGVLGGVDTMDNVGPIARYVDDAFAIFEAIAKPTARPIAGTPAEPVLGVVVDMPLAQPSPDIQAAVDESLKRFETSGLVVRETRLNGLELLPFAAIGLAYPEINAHHRANLRSRRLDYGEAIRPLLALGEILSSQHYLLAQRARSHFTRLLHASMQDLDILVMPTTPMTAGPLVEDADTEAVFGGAAPDLFRFTRYTIPWNVCGFPAITIPCGLDRSGLPIGLQLVARPFGEQLLHTVAKLHEERIDWNWPEPPGRTS